jgi:hypothetical protein
MTNIPSYNQVDLINPLIAIHAISYPKPRLYLSPAYPAVIACGVDDAARMTLIW